MKKSLNHQSRILAGIRCAFENRQAVQSNPQSTTSCNSPNPPLFLKNAPSIQNAVYQAAFDLDGFVLIPFLTPEEVASLTARYDQLPVVKKCGFSSGIYSENEDFKRGCHELLSDVAHKFAAEQLVDYRLLVGNFVLKSPEGESVMPIHQDWTMVDEIRFASPNLWFALTDTNEAT